MNSFANDDFAACRDHVRKLLGIGSFEPGRQVESRKWVSPSPRPDALRKAEFALSLWNEARPIGRTLAERYLTGRQILLTADTYSGHALRFHPACPFRLDSGEAVRLPAMLGKMVNVFTSEFQGIHPHRPGS